MTAMPKEKLRKRPAGSTALRRLKVPRRSLDTRAADNLREAILTGVLKPGERLTEESIAATFQLSRGTIRASLRRLVHEGLVVQEPYRGYSVRSVGSKDAWELFTLRNALEAFAARVLAEAITAEKAAKLTQAYQRVVDATKAGSRSAAVEADFALHQVIAQLGGHSALQAHYSLIAGQIRLYQTLVSRFLSIEDYVAAHEPLVQAICGGHADEAERLASEHNTADGRKLVAWLEEDEEKREKQAH